MAEIEIRYQDGPLDGNIERFDLATDILTEGETFNWRSGKLGEMVYAQYVLRRTSKFPGWVYAYTGDIPMPAEEQPISVLYQGGPRDGETTVLLGSARRFKDDQNPVGAPWPHGYVLHQEGSEMLSGWTLQWEK